MRIEWNIEDGFEELPIHGDAQAADIEVVVYKNGELVSRCLCHACREIEAIGTAEAMDDLAAKPGVYYMEAWSVRHPSGPWGPEEYEGGIRIATKGDR